MRIEEVENFVAEEEDQSQFYNKDILNEEDLVNTISDNDEGNGFLDATGRIQHQRMPNNRDLGNSDQLILE